MRKKEYGPQELQLQQINTNLPENLDTTMMGPNDSSWAVNMPSTTPVRTVGVMNRPRRNQ